MFIISLATLFFSVTFTLLYLSKSIQSKPEWMVKAVNKITDNIDKISFIATFYGIAGGALTLVFVSSQLQLIVQFLVNILVIMLALPYSFERLIAKYKEKLNPAIYRETKLFVTWIEKNEQILGYVGGVSSFLLFAVVFR
jgi:hypothetical protein